MGSATPAANLGGQLNGDSGAFPVLNSQRANDRITVGCQTAHLQTLFDAVAIVLLDYLERRKSRTY